ncbi:MAG: MEKHLA domain-containing protein [Pseudomonadota bacterium]
MPERRAPPQDLPALARLLVDSHLRLVGRPLLADGPGDLAERLWTLPRAVVAHGIQDDPVFCYGNRLALDLFELDFAAFTALPSRFSAEPLAREERAALLERVSRHGFIDDYAGVRISSTGKRFHIRAATVWNLIDGEGVYRGQAASFAEWVDV